MAQRAPRRPRTPGRGASGTSPRPAIRSRSRQNPAWTANYEATKDLPPATGDDIVWSDAVIFGSPLGSVRPVRNSEPSSTRSGPVGQGKLADKVYAAFTSTQTAHGGQETTLITLYISLMHFGGSSCRRDTPTA